MKHESHNQRVGRVGEDAAAAWYEAAGHVVVDRNWRNRDGELDLVVLLHDGHRRPSVAFVEVKARTSSRFGPGVLAVDGRKQERIRHLAAAWLSAQRVRFESVRFDIADVDGNGTVTVYPEAF
jgi:putative endonuclease